MLEREPRKSPTQRFLAEHPVCCFCGGGAKSVERDHVPPQACFPKGLVPEQIEFPACEACNDISRLHDQVFGYHSMMFDYDIGNLDIGKAKKLHRGVGNNSPGALPRFNPTANIIRSYMRQNGLLRTPGLLLKDEAVVKGMVLVAGDFNDAAIMIGRKLGCALYYRHKGSVLPRTHRIYTAWHQVQASGMQELTDYLSEALTNVTTGTRATVKHYGNRLTIRTSDSEDGLFGYAVQFGEGLIVWGMIAEAGVLESTRSLRDTWPVLGEHA